MRLFKKIYLGHLFSPIRPGDYRSFFFSGEFGIKGSERLRRMKKLGTYTLPPQSFQSTPSLLFHLFLAPPPCMEFDIPQPPNSPPLSLFSPSSTALKSERPISYPWKKLFFSTARDEGSNRIFLFSHFRTARYLPKLKEK